MFRDPVLRRSVEEEERFSRDRMPTKPGEPPAYHIPQSPTTQTPFSTSRSQNSPNAPAPLPLHHSNFTSHQHHRSPTSPGTTELPPISTALYASRDNTSSKYYDPTSDHGDRGVAQPAARYESHYSSQVRLHHFFDDITARNLYAGMRS